MDNIIFENNEKYAGRRIDSVLSLYLEDYSRSYIQKLIENGNVTVSGKKIKKNYPVRSDDQIELIVSEPAVCEALPENIPLDILYEDDDILLVNKPKGMVVHPAAGNLNGTLVNALLYHCGSLPVINGVQRPGIVHRIDKDTSGLLVCAKSDIAIRGLSEQFSVHSITRMYRAVVYFGFDDNDGTIDAPIGRDKKNRLKMAVCEDGRRAITHWHVLNRFKGFTEISVRLETGRTHQIRVHMASINHPLLGDEVYGNLKKHPYKTDGQMLHAELLGFIHPVSGKYMEFHADPPEIYLETIKKIKNIK